MSGEPPHGLEVDEAALRALAVWAPRLDDPGLRLGHWAGGDRLADGSITLPNYAWSDALEQFVREMARAGLVRPMDWMAWAGTSRGRELLTTAGAVETASPLELAYLLTSIVRGERFGDGEIELAFERGILGAAARRAAVLVGQ